MLRHVWVATYNSRSRARIDPASPTYSNILKETTVSDLLHSQWRISDQAIANAVGDETVILHLGNGTYYGLDAIGARLWNGLQDGQSPAAIGAGILEAYDVRTEQLEDDLRALLADLAANGLIEPA